MCAKLYEYKQANKVYELHDRVNFIGFFVFLSKKTKFHDMLLGEL